MTNVEVRVRSSYSALSPTCQKAADYLLAHKRELYSIPIAELARQSGVSSAAWVRLCKEIGYTGLKDMRQQLYLQYSAEPQVEVDPTVHFSDLREGKSAQEILQNVTAASLQALQRTSKLMDPAAYQTASDWLLQSKSIKLFGMGASGLVASDLCDKLLRIGKNAIFNFNSHVQLSYSATSKPSASSASRSIPARAAAFTGRRRFCRPWRPCRPAGAIPLALPITASPR